MTPVVKEPFLAANVAHRGPGGHHALEARGCINQLCHAPIIAPVMMLINLELESTSASGMITA
jgi:hypothetical protein